jgi:hypothetical protein
VAIKIQDHWIMIDDGPYVQEITTRICRLFKKCVTKIAENALTVLTDLEKREDVIKIIGFASKYAVSLKGYNINVRISEISLKSLFN